MVERSDALVLFGATGDLAHKKLYPALYELVRDGELDVPVIGVASRPWSLDEVRGYVADGVRTAFDHPDPDVLARLQGLVRYVCGDYASDDVFGSLADELDACGRPLAYLAIPPSAFEEVTAGLARIGANRAGRVVVEKPFGRDLPSARELNAQIVQAYPEEAVFRIDHFLGKAPVLDLLTMRLANPLLEPVWNRHHVASVQITMAEDLGIGTRGQFYEEVGALRDVVQNHLLQVLALVAMELPSSAEPGVLRDEKQQVLHATRALDPGDVVRGQYDGYRDASGVSDDSQVETYVALRAWVDSWRWAGVPFHIRAGKELPVRRTEVLVEFTGPPPAFFTGAGAKPPHPNHLRFQLDPVERIALQLQLTGAGGGVQTAPVDLAYRYDAEVDGAPLLPYTRLIGAAMSGDQALFGRADTVEEAWRIVDPISADPPSVHPYPPGSWGPAAADRVAPPGGWHDEGWPDDAPAGRG